MTFHPKISNINKIHSQTDRWLYLCMSGENRKIDIETGIGKKPVQVKKFFYQLPPPPKNMKLSLYLIFGLKYVNFLAFIFWTPPYPQIFLDIQNTNFLLGRACQRVRHEVQSWLFLNLCYSPFFLDFFKKWNRIDTILPCEC